MVKHIQQEAVIPGVNVTELCGWLRDPAMYAQYHQEYNHNNRITISDWKYTDEVAERDVIFLMPLRGPGILRTAIGTDVIRVHDQHRVTIELEGGPQRVDEDVLPPLRLVIFESKPAIANKGQADIPFAKVKFLFTNLTLTSMQPACKVSVAIECRADSEAFRWLWALQSVIEKVMGAQCKYTADGLIEFWQRECRNRAAAEHQATLEHGAVYTDYEAEKTQYEVPEKETLSPAASVGDDIRSMGSTVYYDAEDDAQDFSTAHPTPNKGKWQWKKLFCCCVRCGKVKEEVPTETHLLN